MPAASLTFGAERQTKRARKGPLRSVATYVRTYSCPPQGARILVSLGEHAPPSPLGTTIDGFCRSKILERYRSGVIPQGGGPQEVALPRGEGFRSPRGPCPLRSVRALRTRYHEGLLRSPELREQARLVSYVHTGAALKPRRRQIKVAFPNKIISS